MCIPRGPTTVLAQGAVNLSAPAQRGLDVTHVVHWSHFTLQPTAPILEFESLTPLPGGGPVRGTRSCSREPHRIKPSLGFSESHISASSSSLPYSVFPVSFQAHLAEGLPPRNHLHKNVFLGLCF